MIRPKPKLGSKQTMAKRKAAEQPQQQAQQQVESYEAMFLLPPAAAMDQDGTGLRLCRSIIERHGGQVIVIKRWDERKLSYEVNGQKRGTYVIAYFRAPGIAVGPIERDVKLSDEILRVMVTKADHLNEQEMNAVEPQPIVREERPSWERDDRGPGGFRPREDRGPRDERPRDDRPREDRPREDRPPRRRDEVPTAEAGAAKE